MRTGPPTDGGGSVFPPLPSKDGGGETLTESEKVVEKLLEAGNTGDVENFFRLVSEDAEYENPITGRTNKEGMRSFHSALWRAFPDTEYGVNRVVSHGDTVLAEVTFRGTQKQELMGIAPTNKKVEMPLAFVIDVKDGKIRKWSAYFDTGTMMRQLGQAP